MNILTPMNTQTGHPLLAGDIGGTKTVLGLYAPDRDVHDPIVIDRQPSREFNSLQDLVASFLDRHNASVSHATFGVAGPVIGGRAQITNLPWSLDESALKDALNIKSVILLNDLQAMASAVPVLGDDEVDLIKTGRKSSNGAIGVIAPGTGLGEAFLVWNDRSHVAYPSEGGHASFAPADKQQVELLQYMRRMYDHVSFERVCSGRGIPGLYEFIRDTSDQSEKQPVAEAITRADDATPVIIDAALDAEPPCPLCQATLSLFVRILGSEAGNLAMKVMATGGIYLGGGIPPRILPALKTGEFVEAFTHKGRLSDMLANIPVSVIVGHNVALMGAARHVFEVAQRESSST